MKEMEMAGY